VTPALNQSNVASENNTILVDSQIDTGSRDTSVVSAGDVDMVDTSHREDRPRSESLTSEGPCSRYHLSPLTEDPGASAPGFSSEHDQIPDVHGPTSEDGVRLHNWGRSTTVIDDDKRADEDDDERSYHEGDTPGYSMPVSPGSDASHAAPNCERCVFVSVTLGLSEVGKHNLVEVSSPRILLQSVDSSGLMRITKTYQITTEQYEQHPQSVGFVTGSPVSTVPGRNDSPRFNSTESNQRSQISMKRLPRCRSLNGKPS